MNGIILLAISSFFYSVGMARSRSPSASSEPSVRQRSGTRTAIQSIGCNSSGNSEPTNSLVVTDLTQTQTAKRALPCSASSIATASTSCGEEASSISSSKF